MKLTKLLNWLNGWRFDYDGWLVRARRSTDPSRLSSELGFVEESAIAVRSHEIARTIDAGRAALSLEQGEKP